jgi:osmoprotectant transport system ATP-binding protein
MIKFIKVGKSFNSKTFALHNISLEISDGETLVLLGSSGSGKTTILKLINRLIKPTAGLIEIDGRNIADENLIKLRRSMGYVLQSIGLFPHMTVAENIAILLKLQKRSIKERQSRVRELLELVNLDYGLYAERFPDELSGGQGQRVGVARALANNPGYLLMDEPFGALDAITRMELQNELIALKQKLQKTIVFVTHDINEAQRIGDRIAVLHNGCLQQVGTPYEIINHPKSQFVSDLIAAGKNYVT